MSAVTHTSPSAWSGVPVRAVTPTKRAPRTERLAQRLVRRRERDERRLARAFRRFFRGQAARVVRRYGALTGTALKADLDLLPASEDADLQQVASPLLWAALIGISAAAAPLAGGALLAEVRLKTLLFEAMERLRRINQQTRRAVQRVLAEGRSRGYTDWQIANGVPKDGYRGLRATVRETSRNRAETIAQTEITTAAQQVSHETWAQAGVTHVEIRDGPDCFVGSTQLVGYGGLIQVIRQWYDGPSCRIRVVTGHELAVGPNHPVLTVRGWVCAKELRPGDQVIQDSRLNNSVSGSTANFVEVPMVEHCFTAADPSFRRPAYRRDLHGDAVHGQGEVEVVWPERGLLFEVDPSFREQHGEPHFVVTADALEFESSGGDATALLHGSAATTSSVVRSDRLASASVAIEGAPLRSCPAGDGAIPISPVLRAASNRGPTASADEFRDRWVPRAALFSEPSLSGFRHARTGAIGSSGLAGGCAALGAWRAVPIVAVWHETFRGWMYDASAGQGVLNGNSIVLRNCGWTSHTDPDLADGSQRTIAEANAYPLAHSNCRRVSLPIRPRRY